MDRHYTSKDRDLVTIFGGSGFVGTHVIQVLARHGYRIKVAVRRPDLAGHLRPMGSLGQIAAVQANIRYPESIARAVAGAGIVINLVGIGSERGRQRFEAVHTAGARAVAEAAKAAGARTLIHMSALGASAESQSAYARSKGLGETEVLRAFPEAFIMRPSILFGPGDGFFNLIASLTRLAPVMPVIGGKTRFQPVFVGDVSNAVLHAIESGARGVYELGGPQIETHQELILRVMKVTNRARLMMPLPGPLANLLALPLSILPGPLLTPDQVRLLQEDNVVSETAIAEGRTVAGLGVAPTGMDAILPSYLWRFRRNGQFEGPPAKSAAP